MHPTKQDLTDPVEPNITADRPPPEMATRARATSACCVGVVFLLGTCRCKEVGLHRDASEKYRDRIHLELIASRVRIIEADVGPDAFHGYKMSESEDPAAYKHLSVIDMHGPSKAWVLRPHPRRGLLPRMLTRLRVAQSFSHDPSRPVEADDKWS